MAGYLFLAASSALDLLLKTEHFIISLLLTSRHLSPSIPFSLRSSRPISYQPSFRSSARSTQSVHERTITMSGQSAPSPAPRSASTGPNGPLATPTSTAMVNGVGGGSVPGPPPAPAAASGASGAPGGGMSQQNLNQIVSRSLFIPPLSGRHARETCLSQVTKLGFFLLSDQPR